jgi:hypothetical protein
LDADHPSNGVLFPRRNTHVTACTEGTWSTRAHGINRAFGGAIQAVEDNIKNLQAVQDLRNSIAHDFARKSKGRDFWYFDPELAGPAEITRISAGRLQDLLRVAGTVAAAVEQHTTPHIGSFELFMFWQKFVDERIKPKTAIVERYRKIYKENGPEKLLSTYYYGLAGDTLSRQYCKSLLRHYNSA